MGRTRGSEPQDRLVKIWFAFFYLKDFWRKILKIIDHINFLQSIITLAPMGLLPELLSVSTFKHEFLLLKIFTLQILLYSSILFSNKNYEYTLTVSIYTIIFIH